jgi:hypothetical protein
MQANSGRQAFGEGKHGLASAKHSGGRRRSDKLPPSLSRDRRSPRPRRQRRSPPRLRWRSPLRWWRWRTMMTTRRACPWFSRSCLSPKCVKWDSPETRQSFALWFPQTSCSTLAGLERRRGARQTTHDRRSWRPLLGRILYIDTVVRVVARSASQRTTPSASAVSGTRRAPAPLGSRLSPWGRRGAPGPRSST